MLNPYKFHSQPQQLMGYAESSTKIPEIAWDQFNTTNEQKRKLEHLWAQYAKYAYLYARQVIKKPWPPGEAAIAADAYFAKEYQKYVKNKVAAKNKKEESERRI